MMLMMLAQGVDPNGADDAGSGSQVQYQHRWQFPFLTSTTSGTRANESLVAVILLMAAEAEGNAYRKVCCRAACFGHVGLSGFRGFLCR